MEAFNLITPVAFIIFNRPDTTAKVFEAIKQAKPKKLLVIADGPRTSKPGEEEKCKQTRALTEQIDWDCEVLRNYSENNLGCRNRVSSGIDWVFENVDEAIIIEDDCLPNPSFFRFCQELLEKYRNNDEIFLISGNKVLFDYNVPDTSYYFSDYLHIWGWATWKKSWQKYNIQMPGWSELNKKEFFKKHLYKNSTIKFWHTLFQEVYEGKIDTWDYQLQYSQWKHNMRVIIPANNLVVNLGFGSEATNTHGSGGLYEFMKFESMQFPLIHPETTRLNIEADKIENRLFHKFAFKESIRRLLLKFRIKI